MGISRRGFIQTSAGASLGAGLLNAAPAMAQQAPAWPPGDQPGFDFRDDRVPMNAANLCPMPGVIRAALNEFSASLDEDMGAPNRRRIEAYKSQARSLMAAQIGARTEEIALVRNTSEANNIIAAGIALNTGDQVLVWNENHPSNHVAWRVHAERHGAQVGSVTLPADLNDAQAIADYFAKAVGPHTRAVALTHISNVSGLRLPVEAICRAIRQKNPAVHLHLDGAQSLGSVALNLQQIDCDSFSASAHKWYMGPREVGLLYVRESRIAHIWPSVVSIPWGSDIQPSVPGAQRFESLGQRNDAALAAFAETVALHDQLGPAQIEQRVMQLANQLRQGFADLGLPLLSPTRAEMASGVVILNVPAANRVALVEHLLDRAGIIAAPVNGLRLAPHIYNTPAHIERALQAVAQAGDLLA